MNFASFVLGPLQTNCFLLHNGREAVVIDPGGEPSEALGYLKSHRLKLTAIFNTHLHFDHTIGNSALQKATGAPIRASDLDRYLLTERTNSSQLFGLPATDPFDYENLPAGETDVLGFPCQILSTPGHTPGGLSFYFPEDKVLFSGDVLFYRSIGRADFPGGDGPELLRSIREKIYTLPGATVVCPGHGPETLVSAEKEQNPFNRLYL